MRNKNFTTDFIKAASDNDVYTFVASNETPDRDGDIVVVKGWEIDRFMKNPVILWAHNNHDLPIGKAINIRKITRGNDKRLEIDIRFADTPFANQVKSLVDGGFLNAVSVGFRVLDWEDVSDDKRAELGMTPWGLMITRSELLETSIVPVPANQEALRRAVNESEIEEKELVLKALDECNDEIEDVRAVKMQDALTTLLSEVDVLKTSLNSLQTEFKELKTLKDKSVGTLAQPKEKTETETNVYEDLLGSLWSKFCSTKPTDNNEVKNHE